jgi:gliding motility-associated-like protein
MNCKPIFINLLFICFLLLFFTTQINAQAPAIKYNSPQSYKINAAISPLTPSNTGGIVKGGTLGPIAAFAGNGTIGAADGPGANASFHYPFGLISDESGNLFVADYDNNKIRKITPEGIVSTFAGNGTRGSENGPKASASFNEPTSIAFDKQGNMIVCDFYNSLIRKISPQGIVSTIAGALFGGYKDGQGSSALFAIPTGVGIDEFDNIFVADKTNNRIRKITQDGTVTTFAGNYNRASIDGTGTSASFDLPQTLTFNRAGDMFVTDYTGNKIRKVTPQAVVTTFAGNGIEQSIDGVGNNASFQRPVNIMADDYGNLFVADNDGGCIRMITPDRTVTTIVKSLNYPSSVTFDKFRNLYFSEEYLNQIFKVKIYGYTIDKPLPAGLNFDALTGIITGIPTQFSPPTDYTVTAYNEFGNSITKVNIEVANNLQPSIITFPPFVAGTTWDNNQNYATKITSTNTETPIVITSDNPAVATINPDGSLHIVGVGLVTITATQTGNANYNPAAPVSQSFNVTKNDQILTFPVIATKTICDADFTAAVTSTNTSIPIQYSSSNTFVATVSSAGVIHVISTGTTTITATQAEGALYNQATPVSRELTVTAGATLVASIKSDYNSTCEGKPITLTATVDNAPPNLNYQWQVNGINAGPNNSVFTTSILLKNDEVRCLVTSTGPCPATGTSNSILFLFIEPYISPKITIAAVTPMPVCSGTPIRFTASATDEGTNPKYQWQVNGIDAGTNSATFISSSINNGDVVSCNLTNQSSTCLITLFSSSNQITASVTSPSVTPVLSISPSVNTAYAGTGITFLAKVSNTIIAGSYQWLLNGTPVGTNSDTYTSSSFKNGDKITCIINNYTICAIPVTSNEVILNILPPPAIKVVNTFTPNGDGYNDTWIIPDLAYYPNCLVSVFNRNGGLVLQSTGYNKPWDGTTGGKVLPPGVYYYVIDTRDGSPKNAGNVTIIR